MEEAEKEKIQIAELKSEAPLLGMSAEEVHHGSDLKGCRRDWNGEKSSKAVSEGKKSRNFGSENNIQSPVARAGAHSSASANHK